MVRRDPVLRPMLSFAIHRTRPAVVRRILRTGFPVAATYGSEAGLFTVTAVIIGNFGAPALAAYAVVNQLVYVVFQISVGISHGSSILVSRVLGLGAPGRARSIATVALTYGALTAAVAGTVYVAAPTWVLSLFMDTNDVAATAIATTLLAVVAVQQFADSAQNIGIGLLRGVGDTTSSFAITLIGYWAVGLPAGLLLAYPLDLQATGMWLGLTTGLAVTAALLLSTFRRRLSRATSTYV